MPETGIRMQHPDIGGCEYSLNRRGLLSYVRYQAGKVVCLSYVEGLDDRRPGVPVGINTPLLTGTLHFTRPTDGKTI